MNFYVLQSGSPKDSAACFDWSQVDDSPMGEAPRCPVCDSVVGMLPLTPPIRVELDLWGSEWGDISISAGDEILVSERAKRFLSATGMTGVERFERVEIAHVNMHRRANNELPTYWAAWIKRTSAHISRSQSQIVWSSPPSCEYCLSGVKVRIDKLVFDERSWSGEDIFQTRDLPGTIFASQRLKDLFEGKVITNARFVPLPEYRFGVTHNAGDM